MTVISISATIRSIKQSSAISLDYFRLPFSSQGPSFLHCVSCLVLQDDFSPVTRPFLSQGKEST